MLIAYGALLSCVAGCATIPKGRFTLKKITVTGNSALDDDEIEERIASRETPRLFGIFSGVFFDYQIFDRFVLERDLQRIERYYRARGYYRARVTAGRVFYAGRSTKVEILIEEGPPVLTRRVDVHGLEGLSAALVSAAQRAARSQLKLGQPFAEEAFQLAQKELLRVLADDGYAYATVQRGSDIDLAKNAASVGFWVDPGPIARFGEVRIEGLGPIPEAPVRRAVGIVPGTPYSRAELDEAQRAILDLGVFSSVTLEPDIPAQRPNPPPKLVPILMRLEPSKLRSVHLGGGVQVDSQKSDVHLTAGWEDRNFFGGLRKFMVEAVPGAVIYPTRLPSFEAPERLLPQARLRSEFRQPGFLEARTNGLLRGEVSMYPILLSSDRDPNAPIVGYRDARLSGGLERSMWRLYGALTHNLQLNSPFTYVGELDKDLGTVLVSYPELFATLDFRDDRVQPHSGAYFQADLQVAGLGGDAQDVKFQPEARGYLPVSRHVTLAARSTVGLLFPRNYGDTVEANALLGNSGGPDDRAWVRDVQLMFLRGFFSGGPGSNRGYASREIGPHGVVPFYNPGQTANEDPRQTSEDCVEGSPTYSPGVCDLPLGGFTLWEASVELRFPLMGSLSGAVFTDASDVAPQELKFRFNRPHVSVGFGFRYDTPIGPVRLDAGYRLPGLQLLSVREDDSADEVRNAQELFGLPIAVSFGIGESF